MTPHTWPELVTRNIIKLEPFPPKRTAETLELKPKSIETIINNQPLDSDRFKVLQDCLKSEDLKLKAEAAFQIAQFYVRGVPGIADLDKNRAIEYLRQAVQADHKAARLRLGKLYLDGSEGGVLRDVNQAIELWEKDALSTECRECAYGLGLAYKATNLTKAFEYFKFAAVDNPHDYWPDAAFELALAYRDGKGVKQMERFYEQNLNYALESNSPQAWVYDFTRLIKEQVPEMRLVYEMCIGRIADEGHREAQFEWAKYLEQKYQVDHKTEMEDKQLHEVEKYYKMASDRGHQEATIRLVELQMQYRQPYRETLERAILLGCRCQLISNWKPLIGCQSKPDWNCLTQYTLSKKPVPLADAALPERPAASVNNAVPTAEVIETRCSLM